MTSGNFAANGAGLALAAIPHNLLRAAAARPAPPTWPETGSRPCANASCTCRPAWPAPDGDASSRTCPPGAEPKRTGPP
jgi:hypothetical protein